MRTSHLLGLVCFLTNAFAQWEPSSYIDVNPPPEQTSLIKVTGTDVTYVGPSSAISTTEEQQTITGRPVIVHKVYDIVVAIVKVAVGKAVVGDISAVISPKVQESWADAAKTSCELTKRDVAPRNLDFATCASRWRDRAFAGSQRASEIGPPGRWTLQNPQIAKLVEECIASGACEAAEATVLTIGFVWLAKHLVDGGILPAVRLPKAGLKEIPDTGSPTPTATPSSSGDACPAEPTPTDKPAKYICEDSTCAGTKNGRCTKGNKCLCRYAARIISDPSLWDDLDEQNAIMSEYWASAGAATATSSGPDPNKTLECKAGKDGLDIDNNKPDSYSKLVDKYCGERTFAESTSGIYDGKGLDASGNDVLKGTVLWFQTDGGTKACGKDACVAAYNKIKKTCQFNSHTLTSSGSYARGDGCDNNFILTIVKPTGDKHICSGENGIGDNECAHGGCGDNAKSGTCKKGDLPYPTCVCT